MKQSKRHIIHKSQETFKTWIVYGIISIITLGLWLPTRYDPFHWDAAGFVAYAAHHLATTNFSPLIPIGSDFAHSPLYIALLGVILKAFPGNFMALHIPNLLFMLIVSLSIYHLVTKYTSPEFGWLSLLAATLSPIIAAESVSLYIDYPAFSLALLAILMADAKKPILASVILSFAVLIKFTALFALPALLVLNFVQHKSILKSLWSLLPLAIWLIWLGYHFSHTGWFLSIPERTLLHPFGIRGYMAQIWQVISTIFIAQQRFWLPVITMGLVFRVKLVKNIWPRIDAIDIALYASLISGIAFFTYVAEFFPRYGMLLMTIAIILAVKMMFQAANHLFDTKHAKLLGLFLGSSIALINLVSLKPTIATVGAYTYTPDDDFQYRDLMATQRQIAAYLQFEHPDAKIFGGFPENVYLNFPYIGYVSRPLDITVCQDYYQSPVTEDHIIVIHPFSPSQRYCRQLLDDLPNTALRRYEQNGKWAELYLVTPSDTTVTTE